MLLDGGTGYLSLSQSVLLGIITAGGGAIAAFATVKVKLERALDDVRELKQQLADLARKYDLVTEMRGGLSGISSDLAEIRTKQDKQDERVGRLDNKVSVLVDRTDRSGSWPVAEPRRPSLSESTPPVSTRKKEYP